MKIPCYWTRSLFLLSSDLWSWRAGFENTVLLAIGVCAEENVARSSSTFGSGVVAEEKVT